MYTANGIADKERYLKDFAPLVKRIAHHMMAKLPASVQVDDMIQAGMIGLLDAINRYEDTLGAQFETYAVQRIRGAMLDELRQADWLPRGMRRNMRRIESTVSSLEQRLGRAPSEAELAKEMGLPLADYQAMLQDARGYHIVFYDDFREDDDEHFLDRNCASPQPNPMEILEDDNLREVLVRAIDDLPEREKLVMGLYYEQELNLREIGEVLGVTESRVCQLHGQAVARLRSRMKALV